MWHWITIDLRTAEAQYGGPHHAKTEATGDLAQTLAMLGMVAL